MTEKPFELRIEPGSDKFDRNDSNWMEQVDSLYSDLRQEVGKVSMKVQPVEGGVDPASIILALGSAGAITAAVQMFQAWLSRDRTRSLTLSVSKGGEEQTITVSGKGMNEAVITELMEAGLSNTG